MSDSMLGGFFAITVKSQFRQEFLDASILEAQNIVSEEQGVFQFHIMVDATNPNRFYFYEVYRDQAAIQEHWDTAVFKCWWNTVKPLIEGSIESIATMRSLFPTTKGFEAQKPGLLQW